MSEDTLDATELGPELRVAIGRTVGSEEPPATLADAVDLTETLLSPGEPFGPESLRREEPTRHAVSLADEIAHVPCVLDALVVAHLVDADPVRVHSGSPSDGTVVCYEVADEGIVPVPDGAVVSFALAPEDLGGPPADVEADPVLPSCGYINSFPDEAAYEEWADATDAAAAMALSVDAADAFARRIAAGPLFDVGD